MDQEVEHNGMPLNQRKYLLGVSLSQIKRKTVLFIIQIEALIQSKLNLHNSINDFIIKASRIKDSPAEQPKKPSSKPSSFYNQPAAEQPKQPSSKPSGFNIQSAADFVKGSCSAISFKLVSTAAIAIHQTSSQFVTSLPEFAGVLASHILASKEEKVIMEHLTELEICVRKDDDLTQETLKLIVNYFKDLDEYLKLMESIMVLDNAKMSKHIMSYKEYLENTYAQSFLWFDYIIDLFRHWQPFISPLGLRAGFWQLCYDNVEINLTLTNHVGIERNSLYNSLTASQLVGNIFATDNNAEHDIKEILEALETFRAGKGKEQKEFLEGFLEVFDFYIEKVKEINLKRKRINEGGLKDEEM